MVAIVVDLDTQERLAALGLLPRYRDVERSEIAHAVSILLRSRLEAVTRDAGPAGNPDTAAHDHRTDTQDATHPRRSGLRWRPPS